jgi:hypothetical protein
MPLISNLQIDIFDV